MPVQFVCSKCHRKLSVGSRKAGCTVACPKCGQENIVPQPAAAAEQTSSAVTIVAAEPTSAPPVAAVEARPEPFDFNGFDDVLQLIEDKPSAAVAASVAVTPPPVAPPPIAVATAGGGPVSTVAGPPPVAPIAPPAISEVGIQAPPVRSTAMRHRPQPSSGFLLGARKALNVRNGVVAGLVVFAFLAGWFAGRAGRTTQVSPPPEPTGEPVPLEGRVLYSLSPGHSLADERAIVIALPEGKTPAKKIDVRGLRPRDQDDLDAVPSAEALRALGGSVVRAGEQGEFVLVVPRPGNYSVLIISRHASRPEELGVGMSDAKELGEYFTSASDLIGQQRYSLSSRRLVGSPPELIHEFGPTDKE